jgi:hypothetical protein
LPFFRSQYSMIALLAISTASPIKVIRVLTPMANKALPTVTTGCTVRSWRRRSSGRRSRPATTVK